MHYQLGNEYNKRGMVDDAIREYKKAIEINDRSPKLYNNLGVAYGKKNCLTMKFLHIKKQLSWTWAIWMHTSILGLHVVQKD